MSVVSLILVSHSLFKHKLENISLIKNSIKLIFRVLCYARNWIVVLWPTGRKRLLQDWTWVRRNMVNHSQGKRLKMWKYFFNIASIYWSYRIHLQWCNSYSPWAMITQYLAHNILCPPANSAPIFHSCTIIAKAFVDINFCKGKRKNLWYIKLSQMFLQGNGPSID